MENSKEFSHIGSDQNMQKWLKNMFEKEDMPSFDESPEFIQALKTIMTGNEVAEKDAKAIIKAEQSMKEFYSAKAGELQLVTDFIQFNSETCQRVASLASLADKMKLKEPTLTCFLLCLIEKEDRELVETEKKFVSNYLLSMFNKKVQHTMMMNGKFKRYLKSLAKVVEKQKTHSSLLENDMIYFSKKKDQVKEEFEKNKEILENAGYLESVRHSNLVKEAQKLKNLEDHCKTLENKLQAYNSLTPNFLETKGAVMEKEAILKKLDEELQLLIQECET